VRLVRDDFLQHAGIRHTHFFCSLGSVGVDHLTAADLAVAADAAKAIAEMMAKPFR
jgi:hypothetical protein